MSGLLVCRGGWGGSVAGFPEESQFHVMMRLIAPSRKMIPPETAAIMYDQLRTSSNLE